MAVTPAPDCVPLSASVLVAVSPLLQLDQWTQQHQMSLTLKKKNQPLNIFDDTDTRTQTQPLANLTVNISENVKKKKKDKGVQTENNIELLIEGEVCADCEEAVIGETF